MSDHWQGSGTGPGRPRSPGASGRPADFGKPVDSRPGTTLPRGSGDLGDGDEVSPWRDRLRRLAMWGVLACSVMVLLGIAGFALAYALVDLPPADASATKQETTLYYRDGKTVLGTYGPNRTSVPFAQIPAHVRNAVLAAEDRDFYNNKGVSPRGIARAVKNNATGGGTQGGSTITQQYVKNVHTDGSRTYSRKAKEFLYALKVDRKLSKDQILERYLNTIYWGRGGALGIQSAAQSYFGPDATVQKLTVSQAAFLAGIIRSPGLYDPDKHLPAAVERWKFVTNAMVETGALDEAERKKLKFPKIEPLRPRDYMKGPKGYLITAAQDELIRAGLSEEQVNTGGLRIVTTFDPKTQRAAEKAVGEGFPKTNASGVHAGLASVQPYSGEVLAMYGGKDYNSRQFNDATQARKQAGSTFKAFTLAAALKEGYNLHQADLQGDEPIRVENENGEEVDIGNSGDGEAGDYGPVSLLDATEHSINTAFVDVTRKIGPSKVRDAVEAAGISRSQAKGLVSVPTVTLGTASVSPVDLANAYATLASGGLRAKAHTVLQVTAPNGNILINTAKDEPTRAFSEDIVKQVTYALNSVVNNGTGKVAKSLGRPAAVKTGTHGTRSGKTVSAWFAGFTPEMATTVNFYREDKLGKEASLNGVGGAGKFHGNGYPGHIWTDYMTQVLRGEPDAPLNMDPGPGAPPAGSNSDGENDPGRGGRDDDDDEEPGVTNSPSVQPTSGQSPTSSPSPSDSGEPTAGNTPEPTETVVDPTAEPSPTCTLRPRRLCDNPDLGLG